MQKLNLKRQLSSKLFRLARSPISGAFIGFSFAYLHRLIPVNRLFETGRTLAFMHPVKAYDFHALAVPKLVKPAFLAFDFGSEDDRLALIDILHTCRKVAVLNKLPHFSIIVNGGMYQDVPQVHFHIAQNDKENEPVYELIKVGDDPVLNINLSRPSNSRWGYHFIVQHAQLADGFMGIDLDDADTQRKVLEMFETAQAILKKEPLEGFSVMINVRPGELEKTSLELVSNHLKA